MMDFFLEHHAVLPRSELCRRAALRVPRLDVSWW